MYIMQLSVLFFLESVNVNYQYLTQIAELNVEEYSKNNKSVCLKLDCILV